MTMEATANQADYNSTASGSSFYSAMRILPASQREAMFQIYSFCRKVDDIADSDGPRPERLAALQQWRNDIDALYRGDPPDHLKDYVATVKKFDLQREDFIAVIDGMEMDVPQDIRAPDMATLDLYCDRVASAVGRLSVNVFGMPREDGVLLAIISAARCSSPTSCATSTRTPASAGSICRVKPCFMPASPRTILSKWPPIARCQKSASRLPTGRRSTLPRLTSS